MRNDTRRVCGDYDGDVYRRPVGLTPRDRPATVSGSADQWVPNFVLYDGLLLRFDGYYADDSLCWGTSTNCAPLVKIYYYLEDDTMTVIEPVTPVWSIFPLFFFDWDKIHDGTSFE